ncbi:MAG: HRDC domain-containing protein, partial [Actinomycetota bacterium]|nr:HRDC domain-containing protein [Actinomycetota bacterium]
MSASTSATQALLSDQEELEAVVAQVKETGRAGLDTEFLREKTYRSKLCLVQVSTESEVYLIEPLGRLDLRSLAELIGDPSVEVVVHAGRQDFELFNDIWGITPKNVFDVQLAAGFAGLGASLPYGRLVHAVVGVALEKGESYSDWCRRPLTGSQLKYAADDVRYLLPIRDHLGRELERLGRTTWVDEEMRLLEEPRAYEVDVNEVWRKVAGRGTLGPRQVAILREIARWREEAASRRDIPRGWVVRDQVLIELARRAPTSAAGVKAIRGVNPKEAERSGKEIVGAIERGKAAPVAAAVASPSRSAQLRARTLAGLADAIVRSRCEHAGVA